MTVPEKSGATTTATAGPSGSSSKKPENPVPDNSWRDNVSSHSQGQTEVNLDLDFQEKLLIWSFLGIATGMSVMYGSLQS